MEFQKYLHNIYEKTFIHNDKLIFLEFLCDDNKVEILSCPIDPENIDNNNTILFLEKEYEDKSCNYKKKILNLDQKTCDKLCKYVYNLLEQYEFGQVENFYHVSKHTEKILFQPRKCFNENNMSYLIFFYEQE